MFCANSLHKLYFDLESVACSSSALKENMFSKFSYVCAFVALFSTNALAQNAKFEGLSIGANTEFKSTTIDYSATGFSYSGFGQQNTGLAVSVDYGTSIGDRAILMFGGKMDLTDTNIIKIEVNGSSIALKEKNRYSIFVAPGLTLNNNTLGHAKLSYESGEAVIEVSGLSVSEKYAGVGYGAGLRTQFNGRWFANIEAMRVVFDTKSFGTLETKTGSTVAAVGLTYKF